MHLVIKGTSTTPGITVLVLRYSASKIALVSHGMCAQQQVKIWSLYDSSLLSYYIAEISLNIT